MSLSQTVNRIKKKLEVAIASDASSQDTQQECMALLKELGSVSMTQDVLKQTKIGFFLNKIRKSLQDTNKDLASAFKLQVKRWQKQFLVPNSATAVAKAKAAPQPTTTTTTTTTPKSEEDQPKHQEGETESATTTTTTTTTSSSSSSLPSSSSSSSSARATTLGSTGISARDRIQKTLYKCLGASPSSNSEAPDASADARRIELAIAIEQEMFDFASGNCHAEEYKSKFRTLSFNLRDTNNADLNESLFNGEMSPRELVAASAKDLGNKELRNQRIKESKDAMEASRQDWGREKMATDTFKCHKCKQRKTTFYMQQTRSSDEPMTTFISCINCGYQWKE